MIELIEQAIKQINLDAQDSKINYHFEFQDFKYESDDHITLSFSINAVSNKDRSAKVTLIEERGEILSLEEVLSPFNLVALKRQELLIRFVTSIFRVLLLGINSPMIIRETEEQILIAEERWSRARQKAIN